MTIPPESIIGNYHSSVDAAERLKGADYELLSRIVEGEQKVEVAIENIDEIEPGEEPGTFIMRLKQEIIENRGKIMVITGASLLALTGLIVQRKRANKQS